MYLQCLFGGSKKRFYAPTANSFRESRTLYVSTLYLFGQARSNHSVPSVLLRPYRSGSMIMPPQYIYLKGDGELIAVPSYNELTLEEAGEL